MNSNDACRLQGIQSLMKKHPTLFIEMIVRTLIATILVINIDAFLKLVVTPLLAATGVGLIIAPLTFFMGQALQPVIHSFCFFGFDDRFIMASLNSTGGKDRLMVGLGLEKWHKMKFFDKRLMRLGMKVATGLFLSIAGILNYIPLAGPFLEALVSGWAVAWDMVYVPLYGIGYVGVVSQGQSVLANFRKYYWFGFWAVLTEEIPVIGPTCHVYNVYNATFFLERVYLNSESPPSGGREAKKKL